MSQVTWRATDELIERVKAVAAQQHRSMNDFLTLVLRAAVDPEFASDEAERTRERLRRAGVLAPAGQPRSRPDPAAVAGARGEASGGTSLADLVGEGRR